MLVLHDLTLREPCWVDETTCFRQLNQNDSCPDEFIHLVGKAGWAERHLETLLENSAEDCCLS